VQLEIRGQRVNDSDRAIAFLKMRLKAAFRRIRQNVSRMTVYLRDVNGPRGGTDKRVRVIVRLRPTGQIIIEEMDADLYAAIGRAARRTSHAVKRELRRRRTSLTYGPRTRAPRFAPASLRVKRGGNTNGRIPWR
jgi:ribosome-associated translation inhibitor RaiA